MITRLNFKQLEMLNASDYDSVMTILQDIKPGYYYSSFRKRDLVGAIYILYSILKSPRENLSFITQKKNEYSPLMSYIKEDCRFLGISGYSNMNRKQIHDAILSLKDDLTNNNFYNEKISKYEDLENFYAVDLKYIAKKCNIKNYNNMLKGDLIDAIRNSKNIDCIDNFYKKTNRRVKIVRSPKRIKNIVKSPPQKRKEKEKENQKQYIIDSLLEGKLGEIYDYENYNVKDLKKIVQHCNIDGYNKISSVIKYKGSTSPTPLKKDYLVKLIKNNQNKKCIIRSSMQIKITNYINKIIQTPQYSSLSKFLESYKKDETIDIIITYSFETTNNDDKKCKYYKSTLSEKVSVKNKILHLHNIYDSNNYKYYEIYLKFPILEDSHPYTIYKVGKNSELERNDFRFKIKNIEYLDTFNAEKN